MNLKKILALFLAFTMVFLVVTPSLAENTSNNKYEEAGKTLKDLGVLVGNAKGDLMLDSNLKRQHMIVLLSILYGESKEASKFVGINKFKDLTPKHSQDIHYINWAVSKGLISGYTDGTFGIDQEITVQEYQSVLLRVLGYELEEADWPMVPQFSEKYGLMEDIEAKASAKMNRGVMAIMTINALRQEKNGEEISLAESLDIKLPDTFKVDYEATVENNKITFTGQVENKENLWISLKPITSTIKMTEKYSPIPLDENGKFSYEIKDLELGEYEFRFQSGRETTKYISFKIDVTAFELDSVSASNLKEIYINFTQPVDKVLASITSNYSTSAGSVKDVRFQDEGKLVILTLEEAMVEDKQYRISANKLKSASGEEVKLKDVEFQARDISEPEITSIKQLGNQGIRIYFSEPIKRTLSTNFKVSELKEKDNFRSIFGNVTYENNSVTLLYHSAGERLRNGDYKLRLANIEDYSGKKMSKLDYDFLLEDDKRAPVISSISATLDRLIIEFDKDIDPESVTKNNIYWKDRNNKYPQSVEIIGNKITADFSNNILPLEEISMHIIGITDYFGNKFSEIEKIKPISDNTTPGISSFQVSSDGTSIDIIYSKTVYGNDKKNYTLISEDNKNIDIKEITGSGREYKIHLYRPLPLGANSLEIDGVQDVSDKYNVVEKYRTNIEIKNTEKPKLLSHSGYGNNIILSFSKEMDEYTITNPLNYIMNFKGQQHKLPSNTSFIPSKDGKSVTLLLPEKYNGEKVVVGRDGNLNQLNMTQLKDVSGNDTNPLILNVSFDEKTNGKASPTDYYSQRPGRSGILTEKNTIEIKFNMPIVFASVYDFSIEDRRISNVIVDGTDIVTLQLEDRDSTSIAKGAVSIPRNNQIRTYIDTGVDPQIVYIWDEIAPRIKSKNASLLVYNNQIEIPFTEALETEGSPLYRRDLEIIRLKDNKLLSEIDYTTSINPADNSMLLVKISNIDIASDYSVKLVGLRYGDTLSYIRDKDGNLAVPSQIYYTDTIRR